MFFTLPRPNTLEIYALTKSYLSYCYYFIFDNNYPFDSVIFSIKILLLSKNCFIWFNESPLKMMNKAFYFILKALFVLKICKFLSWLFGHVGKTAWLER